METETKNNTRDRKEYQKNYRIINAEILKTKKRTYRNLHKEDIKASSKKYRAENSESLKNAKKKYRKENAEYLKEYFKKNRIENLECIKTYQKEYRIKNSESLKTKKRLYREENKEILKIKKKIYLNTRLQNDPIYRMVQNLRGRLRKALKAQGASKDIKTKELFGASQEIVWKHLESQFREGMTRHNNAPKGWHIDHIKPISSFDLSVPEQLKECCHYTNLQPLWWWENLEKSDNIY